ncbi:hypothetical protein HDU96_001643 [Phlyctochytrium bullatum]|nr:hypothetical protein HDU96_001643 [Phlyctochytrium bullatum]
MPLSIERTIVINAPPRRVHEILLDMAKYPDWNPMITSVTGTPKPWTAEEKKPITVWAKTPLGLTVPIPCTAKTVTPLDAAVSEYELSWEGELLAGYAVHGVHSFVSRPYADEKGKVDPNKTTFIHKEEFAGLVTWPVQILGGFIPGSAAAAKVYELLNEALKKRAEEWKE